jgi:NADH-quinone oxidoreductase subunit G
MKELELPQVSAVHLFDDITQACAAAIPALAKIGAAAPDHLFRNAGLKIPRQPHRYSGRTAMRANISMHEPKQPVDEDSPLAFSMEGLNSSQPGALLPFVWAPGWNSNQSLHKFQTEVGGHLKGGTAGVRLLTPAASAQLPAPHPQPHTADVPGQWQLVPRQRLFGSDELSALSPGISDLVEPGFIELGAADAQALGAKHGDGIEIGDGLATLELRINDNMARACAGYSVGLSGTGDIIAGQHVALRKAAHWSRRTAQLIGSDRGAGPGGTHV